MTVCAVLLRGVNLGSHNRVAMPKLRDALTAAGYEDVRTYVASGNVVLRTNKREAALVKHVHSVVEDAFGLDIAIVARTAAELKKVSAANPFVTRASEPAKQLHVGFLSAKPPAAKVKAVDPHRDDPDELRIIG